MNGIKLFRFLSSLALIILIPLAACRRTQRKPKTIRQNIIFVAQRWTYLPVKATKTEKYSDKFFCPTDC